MMCISKARLGDKISKLKPDEIKNLNTAIYKHFAVDAYVKSLEKQIKAKDKYIESLKEKRKKDIDFIESVKKTTKVTIKKTF